MSLLELPPEAPIDPSAIAAWLEPIVPAATLAATPQDHAFHAEGDVWTHTQLAIAALVTSPLYAAQPAAARQILAAAVVLHDIGKPATTREELGKLTSRGHSARGDNLARVALWRLGVPFAIREHICALVRHHQVPFFGITKPQPEAVRLAQRLSLVTRHDWLVAVADADGRGRRCADPADQERIVDHCALWAEHARELQILDRAQPFASPHTRRVWCESESGRQPEVLAHDDTTCEVIVMAGLPATGKNHWLRTHRPGLPVISLDALRDDLDIDPDDSQGHVIAAAREGARALLRTGTSFAWNATNVSPRIRGQVLELARSYRARTHIVYCEATPNELYARNSARDALVPRAAIERMLGRWVVPDPTEAHEVTYAVPGAPGPEWPPRG